MQVAAAIRLIRTTRGPAPWAAAATAWLDAERGRLVLFLPVLMGIGDLGYFAAPQEPPAWLGAACLAPALLVVAAGWRMLPMRAAGLAAAALALGFAAAEIAAVRAAPAVALPTRAAMIGGTVAAVEDLPAGRRVTLAEPTLAHGLAPLPRSLRLRLRADDSAEIAPGDQVTVRAMVRPPSPPAYPGAWDLQRDAWFAGIGGYGYALGALTVDVPAIRAAPGRFVERLRQTVARRAEAALPGTSGAIAATLLTGLSAVIPPADRAAFRDAGLAHLLAIAGLHVGIVMGLVFGLSRFSLALSERAALHWPIKQIAAVAALVAGFGYLVLTGMHVPIVRSFTMAAVVVLALLSGRRAISLRGLLLAAAALILAAPEQLLGVSFQMSFAAVLVLLAGYDAMRPALLRLRGEGTPGRRILCHILGLGLTSLLAGAASAPFAAYHFGHFQLYFVLANMIAVPLTAMWIMPAGLLALALMPLGFDGPAFAVMGWGVQAVLWIARTVSAWPAATIAVPHMPDWGLALVASGLIWLGLWRSWLRLAGVLPLLVGLAAPLLVTPPDILISDDARLIALRTAHGLYAQSAGSDRFVRDSWEQYWAAGPLLDLSAGAANDAVTCTGETCLLRPRATGAAALLLRPGASPVCGQTVTLSSEPVRDCPAIDRFAVWRNGSHAIWLGDTGATILSDRETRGARPWVALGPERRTAPLLPPAQTE